MCIDEEFRFIVFSETVCWNFTWHRRIEQLVLGAGDNFFYYFGNDIFFFILSSLHFELSLTDFGSKSTQQFHLLFWKHSCSVEIAGHRVVKGKGFMRSLLY